MNEEKRNEKIARYFCANNIPVHITLFSGVFYNGIIKEVGVQFLIIDERKEGSKVIFFNEIKRPIQEFKEKK